MTLDDYAPPVPVDDFRRSVDNGFGACIQDLAGLVGGHPGHCLGGLRSGRAGPQCRCGRRPPAWCRHRRSAHRAGSGSGRPAGTARSTGPGNRRQTDIRPCCCMPIMTCSGPETGWRGIHHRRGRPGRLVVHEAGLGCVPGTDGGRRFHSGLAEFVNRFPHTQVLITGTEDPDSLRPRSQRVDRSGGFPQRHPGRGPAAGPAEPPGLTVLLACRRSGR